MNNVFIAKPNENTLKQTPTDVMVHERTRGVFRYTSLAAAGFKVAV